MRARPLRADRVDERQELEEEQQRGQRVGGCRPAARRELRAERVERDRTEDRERDHGRHHHVQRSDNVG